MSLFCPGMDAECKNDAAIKVLENIYGSNFIQAFISGGGSPAAATPAASDLAPILLGGLATVAGMLAIVVFFCLLITSLISSAQDGEAFGKGSAKSIILLRFLFSIVMLMPTGSGYCLAQIIVMFFVLWSNGETNKFYHNVVQASALSKFGGSTPTEALSDADPFGLRAVGVAHFAQAYCHNLLNKNYFPNSGEVAHRTSHTINGVTYEVSSIFKSNSVRAVGAATPIVTTSKSANNGKLTTINITDKSQTIVDNGGPVCGSLAIFTPDKDSFSNYKSNNNDYKNAIGLSIDEQRDVMQSLAATSFELQKIKALYQLQVTAAVSEWMEKAQIPYDFTNEPAYADLLAKVDFKGLQTTINYTVQNSLNEYNNIAINSNYGAQVQKLVESLTASGWTYAGGIKQRIMVAQKGVSGSLNVPMVELKKPQLQLAKIEDERYEKFKSSMSVMYSVISTTLQSEEFSGTGDLSNSTEHIPSEITEDTDVENLNSNMQSEYGTYLTNLKRGIISLLTTGSLGNIKPMAASNLEASWLNDDKDVLQNIQYTGEYIALMNGTLNISVNVAKSAALIISAKVGFSDTLYRIGRTAYSILSDVFVPVLTKVMTYLFILQTYMAVIIPSMPYFFFITGVVAWYIHTLQAMAGIPFWAIMHMIPERSFVGSQTQGYVTIIALFLRPMLTLTGLFFGFILANPILIFVTDAFFTMQESLMSTYSDNMFSGLFYGVMQLFTFFNWLIVYCTLVLQVCYMIFGLAGTLPDTVLKWLGSGLNAGGWGESDAKQALGGGANASVNDTKASADARQAHNKSKGDGGDGGTGGGGGGNGGNGPQGSPSSSATPTQGGVDDARASKNQNASSYGSTQGAGGQIDTGSGQSSPSTTQEKQAQQDFMGAGGVIGSDGKPLGNKDLWKANSTRSAESQSHFGRDMVTGYAIGGGIGAIKGIAEGGKSAIQSFKDSNGGTIKALGGAIQSFGSGFANSIKSNASQGANIMGNAHIAKNGGLPINNGNSTSYTKGGGGGNFASAYRNLSGATK